MKKEQTHTERVTDGLQDAIINGHQIPGQKLIISRIAKQYDVSTSVVREALTRLVDKGLVQFTSNIGFRVNALTETELSNLLFVRELNEQAALRLALTHKDISWEAQITSAYYRLKNTTMILDNQKLNPDWTQFHKEFHFAILQGCQNDQLMDIIERLWNQSELYRDIAILAERGRQIAAEHEEFYQAALAYDTPRLLNIHHQHLYKTEQDYNKAQKNLG